MFRKERQETEKTFLLPPPEWTSAPMALLSAPPESVDRSAALLRDSLSRIQSTTDQMLSQLSAVERRLSALDGSVRAALMSASSTSTAHENIERSLNTADSLLTRFDVLRQAENAIARGTQDGLEVLLTAMDLVRGNIEFFASNETFKNAKSMIACSNSLLSNAMLKIEEEFWLSLSSCSGSLDLNYFSDAMETVSDPLDSSQGTSTNHEREANLKKLISIPPEVLLMLHALAQQLFQARRQMQCLQIYRDVRRPPLEQSLLKFGMERLPKDVVQNMQWGSLEAKIGNWIRVFRGAVKYLFFAERKICDSIFEDIDSLKEQCFAEVTSDTVRTLVGFAEAVSESRIVPEKLFAFLDMYKTMQELQPDMEIIFQGEVCMPVQKSILNLKRNLSKTIFEALISFEKRIAEESTKPSNDGRVHPMTSYVVNYLRFLFDYHSILELISQELYSENNPNYQLEAMIMRLVRALELNMDAKSRQYKDPALTHLFLMNNIHYIVTFVRGSEAKTLLGKDWVDKHRRTVQQNAVQYRRTAWAPVVSTLTTQGLGSSGSGGSSNSWRDTMRDRLKSFNTQFEELHQKHSQWVVRDDELADNLRLAICEILLPAHHAFMNRFQSSDNIKNLERFIKYTPDSLESKVRELFRGGEK